MNNIIAIATVNAANLVKGLRVIAALLFGGSDIRDVNEATPAGIDSSPIKGMKAIYAKTSSNGEPVIIGYVKKDVIAKPGEWRAFSQDANGNMLFNIYCTESGTLLLGTSETAGAYVDNLMRYAQFNTIMQTYLTALNAAVTTSITNLGGAYVTPPAPNFTAAKINEIKTQ